MTYFLLLLLLDNYNKNFLMLSFPILSKYELVNFEMIAPPDNFWEFKAGPELYISGPTLLFSWSCSGYPATV